MLRRSWSVNGDFHFRSDLTQTVQSGLEVDFAEAVVRAFFSLVELLNGLLEKVAREGYSRSLLKKLTRRSARLSWGAGTPLRERYQKASEQP
jgi:hypothetical protein